MNCPHGYEQTDCFGCSKSLEAGIEQFRHQFLDLCPQPEKDRTGYKKWHWDDAWDGELVALLHRIEGAGLKVIKFWRSFKIQVRCPRDGVGQVIDTLMGLDEDIKAIRIAPGKFVQIEIRRKKTVRVYR